MSSTLISINSNPLTKLSHVQLKEIFGNECLTDLTFLQKFADRYEKHQDDLKQFPYSKELALFLISDHEESFLKYFDEKFSNLNPQQLKEKIQEIFAWTDRFESRAITLMLLRFIQKRITVSVTDAVLANESMPSTIDARTLKQLMTTFRQIVQTNVQHSMNEILYKAAAAGNFTVVRTLLHEKNGFGLTNFTNPGSGVMRKALASQNLKLVDYLQKTFKLDPEAERHWYNDRDEADIIKCLDTLKARKEEEQPTEPKNVSWNRP